MTQASFAERLKRIEASGGEIVMHVGIAEEGNAAPSQNKVRASSGVLRFVFGAALMFVVSRLLLDMNAVQAWVDRSPVLLPYENGVMGALTVGIAITMLFFAFKIGRAAMRIRTQPHRLPFACGMVIGFVLGMGPDVFLAELTERFS